MKNIEENSRNKKLDYSQRIYGIHLLNRYEIEALVVQERKEGSPNLANEIIGLRNVASMIPLWLVGETDGTSWHQWIIAKIDTTDKRTAKRLYIQGQYDTVLQLSYTDCIDELYEERQWADKS